jgi:hypothetical protein
VNVATNVDFIKHRNQVTWRNVRMLCYFLQEIEGRLFAC